MYASNLSGVCVDMVHELNTRMSIWFTIWLTDVVWCGIDCFKGCLSAHPHDLVING